MPQTDFPAIINCVIPYGSHRPCGTGHYGRTDTGNGDKGASNEIQSALQTLFFMDRIVAPEDMEGKSAHHLYGKGDERVKISVSRPLLFLS